MSVVSCGYVTVNAPQLKGLRQILAPVSGADLEAFTWTLIWGGEAQPVIPVLGQNEFIFTHRSGVTVTFDGWQVTEVQGLVGEEALNLSFSSQALEITQHDAVLFQGFCERWVPSLLGFQQLCPGLGVNQIQLDSEGQIAGLTFVVHPNYPPLRLQR